MNTIKRFLFLILCGSCVILSTCEDGDYGANPYDPNTPVTVSEMPKISYFSPAEGKTGDTVRIVGINFTTANAVTFGGKGASSFEIKSDSVIEAIVSQYGATGAVGVTNHKGTKTLNGFIYVKDTPVEPSGNLALNKLATASSAFVPAQLAVDGDENTFWQATGTDNEWILVDLGQALTINHIIIKWDNAFASEYNVQVSTDNATFTTVYSVSDLAVPTDDIEFDDIKARFVKVNAIKGATPWNLGIKELEVYNTPNLALNKIATASSAFVPAQLAVDGDENTFWQATGTDDEWILVDLGQVLSINRIIIKWDNAYASENNVQVSTDNATFTTVYSTTTLAEVTDDIKFDKVDARYVKVNAIKGATPWNLGIKELEVYNWP